MRIQKLIQDILTLDWILLSLLNLGQGELQHLVRFLNGGEQLRQQRISQEEFVRQWNLPNLPPVSYRPRLAKDLEDELARET